jgi:predicted RNA-binding protein YlxR (DUF448 family)
VATREPLPPGAVAIRFVSAPDGVLTPDLKGNLAGRGAWIGADRNRLVHAIERGVFARSFRSRTELPAGMTVQEFADRISLAIGAKALNALGLARRCGQLVTGFEVVKANGSKMSAYMTPMDAAPDGVQKLRRALEVRGPVPHIELFVDSAAVSRALGDIGIVHLGLLTGPAAFAARYEVDRWQAFGPTSQPSE